MKTAQVSLAASIVAFGVLVVMLVTAPFVYVVLGERVYQWPDARITVLEFLTLFLFMATTYLYRRPSALKVVATVCLFFSGLNFTLFVLFNYGTNAPDGVLPSVFSPQTAMSILVFLDGLRLSPIEGLAFQTLVWFAGLVVSLFFFRLGSGRWPALLDSLLLASLVLSLYGLGVLIVIPQWSARSVTGLQLDTAFAWFTNDDLLIVASVTFLALLSLRLSAYRHGSMPSSQ